MVAATVVVGHAHRPGWWHARWRTPNRWREGVAQQRAHGRRRVVHRRRAPCGSRQRRHGRHDGVIQGARQRGVGGECKAGGEKGREQHRQLTRWWPLRTGAGGAHGGNPRVPAAAAATLQRGARPRHHLPRERQQRSHRGVRRRRRHRRCCPRAVRVQRRRRAHRAATRVAAHRGRLAGETGGGVRGGISHSVGSHPRGGANKRVLHQVHGACGHLRGGRRAAAAAAAAAGKAHGQQRAHLARHRRLATPTRALHHAVQQARDACGGGNGAQHACQQRLRGGRLRVAALARLHVLVQQHAGHGGVPQLQQQVSHGGCLQAQRVRRRQAVGSLAAHHEAAHGGVQGHTVEPLHAVVAAWWRREAGCHGVHPRSHQAPHVHVQEAEGGGKERGGSGGVAAAARRAGQHATRRRHQLRQLRQRGTLRVHHKRLVQEGGGGSAVCRRCRVAGGINDRQHVLAVATWRRHRRRVGCQRRQGGCRQRCQLGNAIQQGCARLQAGGWRWRVDPAPARGCLRVSTQHRRHGRRQAGGCVHHRCRCTTASVGGGSSGGGGSGSRGCLCLLRLPRRVLHLPFLHGGGVCRHALAPLVHHRRVHGAAQQVVARHVSLVARLPQRRHHHAPVRALHHRHEGAHVVAGQACCLVVVRRQARLARLPARATALTAAPTAIAVVAIPPRPARPAAASGRPAAACHHAASPGDLLYLLCLLGPAATRSGRRRRRQRRCQQRACSAIRTAAAGQARTNGVGSRNRAAAATAAARRRRSSRRLLPAGQRDDG